MSDDKHEPNEPTAEEELTVLRAELSAAKAQLEEAKRQVENKQSDYNQAVHVATVVINSTGSKSKFLEDAVGEVIADRDQLRADNARLQAQVAQMREALQESNGVLKVLCNYSQLPTQQKETLTEVIDRNAVALSTPTGLVRREVLEQALVALGWYEEYMRVNIEGGGKHHCPWCYKSGKDGEADYCDIQHTPDCVIGHALTAAAAELEGKK